MKLSYQTLYYFYRRSGIHRKYENITIINPTQTDKSIIQIIIFYLCGNSTDGSSPLFFKSISYLCFGLFNILKSGLSCSPYSRHEKKWKFFSHGLIKI